MEQVDAPPQPASVTTVTPPEPATPSEPARNRSGRAVQVAASAAMGGFLFGYDSAVINGAIPGLQRHFDVGAGTLGLTVSAALLGSAVGAGLTGTLADRIGRTRVMQIAAVLFAVSALASAVPFAVWDLAAWRAVGGVAIGMTSVVGPTYISEVAPPAIRGRLASFQQMAIVLGIAVSQLANYAIAALAGGTSYGQLAGLQAWQWMLGVCLLPSLLYLALALTIPESPRFLIASGRLTEARAALAQFESGDLDARVEEIRASISTEQRPKLRELCGRFGLLPVVWIGIALGMLQQLVGINVIFYYSSVLWQSVGVEEDNSLLIGLSTSVINIVGTVAAMLLVDRLGRKPLLVAGSIGMTVSLATAAWAFSYAQGSGEDVSLPATQGAVALIAAHAFVLCFAFSWGAVLWVLLGEIFPGRIRAVAMSVATTAHWLANWMITVSFPNLAEWDLSNSYLIYTALSALSLFFAVKYLKETKGKNLEETTSAH